MIALEKLGWDNFFEESFKELNKPELQVGRVGIELKHQYLVYTKEGDLLAEVSGRLHYRAKSSADLPKVGDWVTLKIFENERKALIQDVLPRKSKLSRKVKGKKTDEQVVVANVDVVFVVQSLDETFNTKRIERYLAMAFDGGTKPAIILTKADLCSESEINQKFEETKKIALKADIFITSVIDGRGIEEIKASIKEGLTYAFVGHSGVGKSTIINKIIGQDLLKTGEVRTYDSKGRHTTTRRELVIMPQGGILIDTPGLREIQLWDSINGLKETFADIEELATQCKFSDCSHEVEIDCAVKEALLHGKLSQDRYNNYIKLKRELAQLATRQRLASISERKRKSSKKK